MQQVVEFFSFLPYGKYGFYIWLSYIICFIVLAVLVYKSAKLHNKTLNILKLKYARENEK
jgi:heme exporter protein D